MIGDVTARRELNITWRDPYAALDSGRFAAKVQRDQQDGNNIGVHATPSIFINGRYVSEPTYEAVKAALDAVLTGK